MEHWNNEQEVSTEDISLRQILETRYLLDIMEILGIEHIEELKGNTIAQLINDAIDHDEDGIIDKDKDIESYIRSQSNILFRIFNIIIKDSRKKLHFGNNVRYHFNNKNVEFIFDLLDLYEENDANCEALLNGEFNAVEDEFLNAFLYNGFLELARNEKISLQVVELDKRWRELFNPDLRDILRLLDDLSENVRFYVGEIVPEEENIEAFKKIKSILRECNDQIVAISKETIVDDEIDLDRDIPIEEIPFIAPLIKLKLRRDRANKGWEKRKGKQK